jgi:tRNA(Leu) C34 or U34 (ribose-2'-O)-methylase TrmL
VTVSVLLIDPEFAHNVGNTLRACALLGAGSLWWTGDRVAHPEQWGDGTRLPREERMRCYRRTQLGRVHNGQVQHLLAAPAVPVCVEITDSAQDLRYFEHPRDAVYVFGPENGSVPKGMRQQCHLFVRIPNAILDADPDDIDGRTPYNLAAAVNIVLFHRLLQQSVTIDPNRIEATLRDLKYTW